MADRAAIERRRSRLSSAQQAQLARRLVGSIERLAQADVLEPRPASTAPPLSYAQERLWFLAQLSPQSPAYNRPLALRIEGRVDRSRLEQALGDIVGRHEALRATFHAGEGIPFQAIHDVDLSLRIQDLGSEPTERRLARARAIALRLGREPFDLTQGPLYRAKLLRLDDTSHLLVLVFHHLVFDAWSAEILLRELATRYQALSGAAAPPIPQLPAQYADFAHRQREEVEAGSLDRSLERMAALLHGAPPALELPTTRKRPLVQTFRGGRETLVVPAPLLGALESLGHREGATLFMVLVSAFLVLLRRYTGEEDLVIGCPTAGRSNVASEGMIGVFVNMLVLRADLSGNPPFRRLLQRVRHATLEMLEHRDVPFGRLVERLNPARDPSRTPVFQVIFNLENVPGEPVPGTRFRIEHFDRGVSAFDVELELRESGDELFCDLTYNRDLFEIEMIQGLARAYMRLLEGVVEDADRPIDRLPLLSPEARHRLLVEWNESATDSPTDVTMHQVFASQAKRRPDAPALISSQETLTYRQLDERTNQLARHLVKLGVAPGRFVVLCIPRSIDLVVAALATLKAGGAYVPLDPDEPGDRRASMLADVQPAVILTRGRLESDRSAIDEESTHTLVVESLPDAPAYVIYTSGTTGNPKGVVVPHRAVLRLLIDARFVDLDESQTHLLLAPFSFDAAAFELWGSLLNGGCCVVAPDIHPTPKELEAIIEAHGVTTLWLTSSLFNVVIDENPRALSRLAQLLIGGEALSVSHVRRGMKLLPVLRIINGYGPTEATIFSTSYELQGLDEAARSVPIGHPVGNTKIYILDGHLEPVPLGVAGDLYIGGEGLALGYLHAPELTAERFIGDPFAGEGDRMYRSGDLARYLPDGSIEFLGRRDRQVKIRGFRVELGEIEAALRTCDGVQDAVVAARQDHRGERRLVAAVSGHAEPGEVRRQLERKLPAHMVPHPIATMDTLPRTSSGKASADALPDLVADLSRETEGPVIAPRNRTERDLAGIWRDVLELPTIDVRDDFFDLGGHSLLAARMFARIEHVFGKDIPVVTLFQAPTIEQLAAVVDATDGSRDWSSLIPISPGGTNPPFFCVAHGDVIGLERLAAHLPDHQPFYGLQAPGLALLPPSPGSIEEMATEYIAEVRRVQPRGPYYLGGRCIGSVVAFEMAKQLDSEGDEVAVVVVQDTLVAPTLIGVGEAISAGIAELRKGPQPSIYRRAVVSLRRRLPGPVVDLLRAIIAPVRGKPRKAAPLAATPADLGQERRTERIRQANYNARDWYSTTPYSGRLALLQGANSEGEQRLQRVWQYTTTGPFEVHPIPGKHDQIWKEPWVRDHARHLMARIEHAMSSVSG